LRDELPRFFAGRDCIVVYATTEPVEALLFGGNTATLHEGRITQFGPTSETYRRPADLTTARVFSDPPINVAAAVKEGDRVRIGKRVVLPLGRAGTGLADGAYRLGIRPHHIRPVSDGGQGTVEGRVLVAELSGSDSVLHFDMEGETWVSQSSGVHPYPIGSMARLAVDMDQCLFFDEAGRFIGGGAHG
jgi:glycerol transport system ATP-binding protein